MPFDRRGKGGQSALFHKLPWHGPFAIIKTFKLNSDCTALFKTTFLKTCKEISCAKNKLVFKIPAEDKNKLIFMKKLSLALNYFSNALLLKPAPPFPLGRSGAPGRCYWKVKAV